MSTSGLIEPPHIRPPCVENIDSVYRPFWDRVGRVAEWTVLAALTALTSLTMLTIHTHFPDIYNFLGTGFSMHVSDTDFLAGHIPIQNVPSNQSLVEAIWSYLKLIGAIWSYVEICRAIWSYL